MIIINDDVNTENTKYNDVHENFDFARSNKIEIITAFTLLDDRFSCVDLILQDAHSDTYDNFEHKTDHLESFAQMKMDTSVLNIASAIWWVRNSSKFRNRKLSELRNISITTACS